MKKRREINDRLVGWISETVRRDYAGDIALAVVYGSHVNGTYNRMSDVDCFYVPKTKRGEEFGRCFVLDGVGYDIFPVSWERLEGIADLQESLTPLVGDGKIIYRDTEEDAARYCALGERLKEKLSDDKMTAQAVKNRVDFAAQLAAGMEKAEKPAEKRTYAGYIATFLADAAAFHNHDYYHFGLKTQYRDMLEKFTDIPQVITDGYRNIAEAESAEKSAEYAKKMLRDVCAYVDYVCEIPEAYAPEEKRIGEMNADALAELYEEIVSTFNKIYICCENDNHILAFISGVCLQHELDEAMENGCPAYDLVGGFNWKRLDEFAVHAKDIEQDFVRIIEKNGGKIKRYADFDEFAAENG